MMSKTCQALPPSGLSASLRDGSPCPLPTDGHVEHLTTTPDGRTWRWDGFTCAYPENCAYEGDPDCCVSYSEAPAHAADQQDTDEVQDAR